MIQTAALLLVLATAPALAEPTPSHALFWGGERTWLVDVEARRLLSAPGWWVADREGVWRYRTRIEVERDGHRARRRRRVERLRPGAKVFEPVGPAATGAWQDEAVVLQFTGEALTMARLVQLAPRWAMDAPDPRPAARPAGRTRSGHGAGRPTRLDDGASGREVWARTLSLPSLDPAPPLPAADLMVSWLSRWPEVVDPCVRRPAGALRWDLRGRQVDWLLLGPDAARCAGHMHAFALARSLPDPLDVGAPDAVDVRPLDRDLAIVLRGDPLPDAVFSHRDLLDLTAPCAQRRLQIWRRDAEPIELGEAPRLDGLRWIALDHPLVAAARRAFRPADQQGCTAPPRAVVGEVPDARLCRIDEPGPRAWTGPGDLSAAVDLELHADRIEVVVRVRDDPHPEDRVRLWFGRRARLVVGPEAIQRRRARGAQARWTADPEGYRVEVTVPRALAGDPPSLTVAVHDTDADAPGHIVLWAAGHPIDRRRPGGTPVALPAEVP